MDLITALKLNLKEEEKKNLEQVLNTTIYYLMGITELRSLARRIRQREIKKNKNFTILIRGEPIMNTHSHFITKVKTSIYLMGMIYIYTRV